MAARDDRHIDCHTVISKFLQQRMQMRFGLRPDRVSVVRTGIDLHQEFVVEAYPRGEWRRINGVQARRKLVAFVGRRRFSDLKRPALFMEIARRMLPDFPDALSVLRRRRPVAERPRPADSRRPHLGPRSDDGRCTETGRDPVARCRHAGADQRNGGDRLCLLRGYGLLIAIGVIRCRCAVGTDRCTDRHIVETGKGELERYVTAAANLLEDDERRRRMGQKGRERLHAWPGVDDMATAYHQLYPRTIFWNLTEFHP